MEASEVDDRLLNMKLLIISGIVTQTTIRICTSVPIINVSAILRRQAPIMMLRYTLFSRTMPVILLAKRVSVSSSIRDEVVGMSTCARVAS